MRKLIYILIIFICISFQKGFAAYDPQFSQFYASPLYLGPSFAGILESTRFIANFRDQWPKIPNVYITYAFSADHYIDQYKSGIGCMVLRDQAGGGKLNTTNIYLQYAYKIKLGNIWRFRPGLQFSYFQKNINYSKVVFSDQMSFEGNNPTSVEIPVDSRIHQYDFATSVLFYNRSVWIGSTLAHLINIKPGISKDDDDYYSPRKFTFYGGAKVPLESTHYKRDKHSLFFAFHFINQGKDQQLDFGTYYEKSGINVGLWYRGIPIFANHNDALTLLLGYKINNISIGYSYDITVSKLILHTGGAHELSVTYVLKENAWIKRKRITPVPCPIF